MPCLARGRSQAKARFLRDCSMASRLGLRARPTVVDLHQQAALLGGLVHVGRPAEGVVQVERDRVRDILVLAQLGVLARLAATHLVRLGLLAANLEDGDEQDDLHLA